MAHHAEHIHVPQSGDINSEIDMRCASITTMYMEGFRLIGTDGYNEPCLVVFYRKLVLQDQTAICIACIFFLGLGILFNGLIKLREILLSKIGISGLDKKEKEEILRRRDESKSLGGVYLNGQKYASFEKGKGKETGCCCNADKEENEENENEEGNSTEKKTCEVSKVTNTTIGFLGTRGRKLFTRLLILVVDITASLSCYLCMLGAMTYSIELFSSVVIGLAIGKSLFHNSMHRGIGTTDTIIIKECLCHDCGT